MNPSAMLVQHGSHAASSGMDSTGSRGSVEKGGAKEPRWLLCIHGRFKRVGQDGPLTRLMACTKEELEGYTPMDTVDTYIAPSFAQDSAHSDDYPPYNKPGAVVHWLRVSPIFSL